MSTPIHHQPNTEAVLQPPVLTLSVDVSRDRVEYEVDRLPDDPTPPSVAELKGDDHFAFCPYCGKALPTIPAELYDEDEDEDEDEENERRHGMQAALLLERQEREKAAETANHVIEPPVDARPEAGKAFN